MLEVADSCCRPPFGRFRISAAYVGPEFVRRILRRPREELLRLLRGWRESYLGASRRKNAADAGTDVSARVTQVFATIYAAGRLAIHLGLFTWDVRAFGRAILSCEGAHRDLARTAAPTGRDRTDDPLDAVREYVRAETGRRIVDLRDVPGAHTVNGDLNAGFLIQGPDGRAEFFVSSTGLEQICGSKVRENALKRRLHDLDPCFGGETRFSMKRPIFPDQPRSNGIAIPLLLLGLEEGNPAKDARSLPRR